MSIDRQSLVLPSLAIDASGHGVLGFTTYGAGQYPSQAYVPINETGTGPATIVASGAVPLDNFDGYS